MWMLLQAKLLMITTAFLYFEKTSRYIVPNYYAQHSSSRVSQTSLFSRPHQLALTGGSRGIPRPVWRYIHSTWSLVYPVASSQLDVPGTPPEGSDQVPSLPDAQTTSTGSFLRKGAAALLLSPSRKKTSFWLLVSVISFFRS